MSIPESIKKLQMKFSFRTEATLAGVNFGLQVLSFKDEQKVQSIPTMDLDGMAFFNEMQKGLLSYAIRSIDGEELPDVIELEEGKSKDRPIFIREMLDNLPNKIVQSLFEVYVDLREQKEDDIQKSLTYSWYKTPEQREKERKEKETRLEKETKAAKESEEVKATLTTEGATGINAVPSPDGEIKFTKLATDYSDVDAKSRS